MATGVKGVTFHEPAHGQPAPAGSAVQAQALRGVAGTGGVEPADGAEERGNGHLVDPDQPDEQACDHWTESLFQPKAARKAEAATYSFSYEKPRHQPAGARPLGSALTASGRLARRTRRRLYGAGAWSALAQHLTPPSLDDWRDLQPLADHVVSRELAERRSHQDYQVAPTRPKLGGRAKSHAHETLGAIAHYSAADLARSRDAEPRHAIRVGRRRQDQHEVPCCNASPRALDAQKLSTFANPRGCWKWASSARERHGYFL